MSFSFHGGACRSSASLSGSRVKAMIGLIGALLCVILIAGCDGDATAEDSDADSPNLGGQGGEEPEEMECTVEAPTSCPDPAPTYVQDIRPMIESLCLSCHYGEPGGPWTLDGYEHLANWHDLLRGAMLSCSMPPKDSGIAMSDDERMLLLNWLRCGFPEE